MWFAALYFSFQFLLEVSSDHHKVVVLLFQILQFLAAIEVWGTLVLGSRLRGHT